MKQETRMIEIKSTLTERQLRDLRLAIARAVLKIDRKSTVWLIDGK